MRVAALFSALFLTCPALACPYGSEEPLRVVEWSKTPVTRQGLSVLTVTIENATGRGVRMAKASVRAYDKLGREIGGWLLDPDLSLPAGEMTTEKQVLPFMLPRLLTMNPEDARFVVCTTGLVFDGGEAERY